MRRAAVISNCQARPIAEYLKLRVPHLSFDVLGVHLLSQANLTNGLAEFLGRIDSDCDLILTAPLSASYGAVSTDELAKSFPKSRLIVIPNIYFSGLHPDLTYLGGLGQRIQGPLGDYHSKIAAVGFASGRSVKDTCLLFNENTYHKMSYFSEFESSMLELKRREEKADFKVSDIIQKNIRAQPCFMTTNHPTSFLFSKFVDGLVDFLLQNEIIDFAYPSLDYHFLQNPLAEATIFPIYPEIADFHHLEFSGNYLFKGPRRNGVEAIFELEGFVRAEYEALEIIPSDRLANHPLITSALNRL